MVQGPVVMLADRDMRGTLAQLGGVGENVNKYPPMAELPFADVRRLCAPPHARTVDCNGGNDSG